MHNFNNEQISQCDIENVSLKENLSQKGINERQNLLEFEYPGNQKYKIRKSESFNIIEETDEQNQNQNEINIIVLNDKQSYQEIEQKKYQVEQDQKSQKNNRDKKSELLMCFDDIDHQTQRTQNHTQKQNNVQLDAQQQFTEQIIQISTLFKNLYSKVDLSFEQDLQSLVITKQNLSNEDLFENECEKLHLLVGKDVTLDIIKIDKSTKQFTQIAGKTNLYLSKYKIEDKTIYDLYFLILLDKLITMHDIGIAHSDIKPSNIVLSYQNQPYFIDFDASVLLQDYHKYFEFFTPSYNLDIYMKKKKSGLKFESSEEIKLCDKTQLALSFLFLFCEDDNQLKLFKNKDINELLLIQSKNKYSNNREFVIQIISRILNQADPNIKITGTQNQLTFIIDHEQINKVFKKLDDIQFNSDENMFEIKRIDKFSLKLIELLDKLNYFIEIEPSFTQIIPQPEMEEFINICQKHKLDQYYQQLINFSDLDLEDVFNVCQYLKTTQNKKINIKLKHYNDYQIFDKHIQCLNNSNSLQVNFLIHQDNFFDFFHKDSIKINNDMNECKLKIVYEFLKSELLKYSFQIGFIEENLIFEIQFDEINKSIEKDNELNNIKNNLSILNNFNENESKLINYLKIFKHVYKFQNLKIYQGNLEQTIFCNINDEIYAIMDHISTMEQGQTLFFQQGSKIKFQESDIVQLLKYQDIELDKDSQKYYLKSLINIISNLHDQLDKYEFSVKEIVLEKGEKLFYKSLERIKMFQQKTNLQKLRFTFSCLMFTKQMWIEIENMIERKDSQYIEIIFIDCLFYTSFIEILKHSKIYSISIEFYTNDQELPMFYNYGILLSKQKYNETRIRIIFIRYQIREIEQDKDIKRANKNGYCEGLQNMFKNDQVYKDNGLQNLKMLRIEIKNKIANEVQNIDDIKLILKEINNNVHYTHINIHLLQQQCKFSYNKLSNFRISMEYDIDLTESIVLELLNELFFSILTHIIIQNKYELEINQKKTFLTHIIKQKIEKYLDNNLYLEYEITFNDCVLEQFITDFREFQHKYFLTDQKLTQYIIQNKDFKVNIFPLGLKYDQFQTFFNLIHDLIPSKNIEFQLSFCNLSISTLYYFYETIISQKNEGKNISFVISESNIFFAEFELFVQKIIKDTQNQFHFFILSQQLDFLQYMKIKFKDILRIKNHSDEQYLYCEPLKQNQKYQNKYSITIKFESDNFKNIKNLKQIVQSDSTIIKKKNHFLNKKQTNSDKTVNADINNDKKKKKKIEIEQIEVEQKQTKKLKKLDQMSLANEKRKDKTKKNKYLQRLEDLLEIEITDQLKDGQTIHLNKQGYVLIKQKIRSIKKLAKSNRHYYEYGNGQFLDFDEIRKQLKQNNKESYDIDDIKNTDINLSQIYYEVNEHLDINVE